MRNCRATRVSIIDLSDLCPNAFRSKYRCRKEELVIHENIRAVSLVEIEVKTSEDVSNA